MDRRTARRVGAAVRYATCAAAIGWIAWTTRWDQLREVLRSANLALTGLALLSFGPALVLISIRLKLLLAVQSVHLSTWDALRYTFAGNFLSGALPLGTGGGDTLKAYLIARSTPHKHEAVTTIFVDRIIGLTGLLLMSGICVLAQWGNPALAKYGNKISVLVLLLIVGAGLYYSKRARAWLRVDRILDAIPLGHHVRRIDRAAWLFRKRYRRVVLAFILTGVLQFNSIVSFFLAGWSLGLVGDSPTDALPIYLAYTPIALLAGGLPIGVMELVFKELLSDTARLGSAEAALSLSLFGRIMQLLWALPGALVLLRERPADQREVEALTEQADQDPPL